MLRSFAREVGIHIESVPHPTAAFWAVSREDDCEMFHTNTPASTLETAVRYFHALGMLAPNRVPCSDEHTDQIIDAGRAASNLETAFPYAKEFQRIVAENALWIPLVQQNAFIVTRHWVDGVRPHGQYGGTLSCGHMDIELFDCDE